MTRRRGTASIVASPVLVGAVTTLIIVIGVFLAYNANQGLPFVPTYDLRAELPGGANLVRGNEVRVGGFRVGVVDELRPGTVELPDGGSRAIAVIAMKLDKTIEPLPLDTKITVRPRSALGLKYVELSPGKSSEGFRAGSTIALAAATEPVEFDDVFNTFDENLRENSRTALKGFGDALAGRGPAINETLAELPSLFRHLEPVMRNLSDPDTELDEFFKQIGRTAAQVAPVARVQGDLFANMADTFEAFSRNPRALQDTIAKTPPTLDAGIRSFPVQRPFLADFADLSRRLRPAARELPRSLPALNRAFRTGRPVLARSVAFNQRTEDLFEALDELASDPNTLLGLKDLDTTVTVTAPLVEFVAPYQTVCNSFNYFFTTLANHFSEDLDNGTAERVLNNSDNGQQDNRPTSSESDRQADVPANEDPQRARAYDRAGRDTGPLTALHGQPYGPAIDAQGNADCQVGQTGYLQRLHTGGRYPPSNDAMTNDREDGDWSANNAGGSHLVVDSDTPGLAGPTFKRIGSDELGPRNLKEVP